MYHQSPSVSSVYPPTGPESGSTVLVVTGENFVRSSDLQCKFYSSPTSSNFYVPATYISPTAVKCATLSSVPHTVDLSISTNGQPFGESSNTIPFEFSAVTTISSITPSQGVTTGNTPVTLMGTGFSASTLLCKFGNVVVTPSIVYDSTTASCVAPPAPASLSSGGDVSLTVSSNNGVYTGDLTYTYKPAVTITTISPRTGPATGGTTVTVYGSNFAGDFSCFFGPAKVDAVLLSSGMLSCVSPASSSPSVYFEIKSKDEADTTASSIVFTFAALPTVASVSPASGKDTGGTLVTLTGNGFLNTEHLSCKFGEMGSIPAIFVSPTRLTCSSPAATSITEDQDALSVPVTVSLNSQQFSETDATFSYAAVPSITNIAPTSVSSLGGAPVTLSGSGFFGDGAQTVCSFDGTLIEASSSSDTTFVCVVPPRFNTGEISVAVSTNGGVEFSEDSVSLTITIPTLVSSVTPSSGPASGGYPLTLATSELAPGTDSYKCKFLDSASSTYTIEEATLDALDNSITCAAAPESSSFTSDTVYVSVSTNGGAEFSSRAATFTFLPSPAVTSAVPNFTHERGGTQVTLTGTSFPTTSSATLFCHFGAVTTEAVKMTSTKAACVAPASTSKSATTTLSLSTTATTDDSTSSVPFSYLPLISISSMLPASGPIAGGTSVTLIGTGFDTSLSYACVFSDSKTEVSTVLAPHSSTSSSCPTPPAAAFQTTSVTLSLKYTMPSGLTYPVSDNEPSLPFLYRSGVHVSSVSPSTGPKDTSTVISVFGSNFVNSPNLACGWFTTESTESAELAATTPATYVSSYHLTCATPTVVDVSSARVEVSLNAKDYTSTSTQFYFHDVIAVTALMPSSGPESGGTSVTVVGSNFMPFSTIACKFTNKQTEAELFSASTTFATTDAVMCVTPTLSPGEYAVSVSNNNIDFSDSSATFTAHAPLSPISQSPVSGPASGGTEVTVKGAFFPDSKTLSCKFGDKVTKAKYVSSTELTCVTPSAYTTSVSSSVPVSVSGNGREFTTGESNLSFIYAPLPSISQVYPVSGSVDGGTTIQLAGSNLDVASSEMSVLCRFGSQTVPATVISPSQISCVAPSSLSSVSIVSLEVSTNSGTDFSKSGLTFRYSDLAVPTALLPPAGIEDGGFKVIVTGSGFYSTPTLGCKFGNVFAPGTYVSSDRIECTAPPAASVGAAISVGVTLNGVDFSSQELTFTYTPSLVVSLITPASSPIGSTTTVTVTGENFAIAAGVAGLALSCDFGDYRSTASVISDTEITCDAPSVADVGNYVFDVTSNGNSVINAHVSRLAYEFFNPSSIYAVKPSFGRVGGGTLITVTGTNFLSAGSVSCGFESNGFGAAASEATVVSDTELTCISPSLPSSISTTTTVHADLSINSLKTGVKISQQSTTFAYRPELTVLSLHPATGNLAGGTDVTVKISPSSTFVNSDLLACAFGSETVPATFLSSTVVKCTTLVDANRIASSAKVSVSNNGVDFDGNVDFNFSVMPTVAYVAPATGPSTGGTVVTVTGSNFDPDATDLPFCEFSFTSGGSSTLVRATQVLSSTTLTCAAPARFEDFSAASVRVTLNGVEFDTSTASPAFSYYESPELSLVTPVAGISDTETIVTVTGTDFSPSYLGDASCKLVAGDATVAEATATAVTTTSVTCELKCPDVKASSAVYALKVSMNGVDYTQSGVAFYCDSAPVVSAASPATVEVGSGATTITVTGQDFFDRPGLSCVRMSDSGDGVAILPATYLSSTMVSCSVPKSASPSAIKMFLSNDGVNFQEASSFSITYHSEVTIDAVSPSITSRNGVVTLTGSNFVANAANLGCFVNDEVASAVSFVDENTVTCKLSSQTPILSAAQSTISLSFNNVDFTTVTHPLTILETPTVSSVYPTGGLISGGSQVSLQGTNFIDTPGLKCKFGTEVVDATFVSSTMITCFAPAATSSSRAVSVLVSNDNFGSTPSTANVAFSYFSAAEASHLAPSSGPTDGGTALIVAGSNFDPTLTYTCELGGETTAATFISTTSISCLTPPSPVVKKSVELLIKETTFNSVFATGSTSLRFDYFQKPIMTSLEPSTGPVSGGAFVTVQGTGFDGSSGAVFCKFGSSVVSAMLLDEKHISCQSPPATSASASTVSISASINGADYVTNADLKFAYYSELNIDSVSPASGTVSGGTMVTVGGTNFTPRSDTQCKFGEKVVFAYYATPSSFVCVAPAQTAAGVKKLMIKYNSESDWVDSMLPFDYHDAVSITSISPASILETGMEAITISGTNFDTVGDKDQISCRFGRLGDLVPAKFLSATLVTCVAGAAASGVGEVAVSLTMNGVDFVNSLAPLKYVPHLTVSSISPALGPLTGGTSVTVTGTGFLHDSDILCAYGSASMIATYISSTAVTCDSAPLFVSTHHSVDISSVQMQVVQIKGDVSGKSNYVTFDQYWNVPSWTVEMQPVASPTAGHTRLTVSGFEGVVSSLGASADPVCKFAFSEATLTSTALSVILPEDATAVAVVDFATSTISCDSPPMAGLSSGLAFVPVYLSLNGGHDFPISESSLVLTYYPDISIGASSPSSLPAIGSSEVFVSGSNLPNIGTLGCKFGQEVGEATYISSELVKCALPASFAAQASATLNPAVVIGVMVTGNGQQFTEAIPLELRFEPKMSSLGSPVASTRGGTVVTVMGNNFASAVDGIRLHDDTNPSRPYLYATTTCSSSTICTFVAPSLALSNESVSDASAEATSSQNLAIEMSYSNYNYITTGLSLTYYPELLLASISPLTAMVNADVSVTLTGSNFLASFKYECVFTGADGAVVSSPSQRTTSATLACSVPVQSTPTTLQVQARRVDDQDTTSDSFPFIITDDHALTSVLPISVPEGRSTVVTLMGTGIIRTPELSCLFFGKSSEKVSAPATFKSDTTVECSTPAGMELGATSVFLSTNGVDAVGNSLSLLVVGERSMNDMSVIAGPASGGTPITVTGAGFALDGSSSDHLRTFCQFGDYLQTVATILSDTELTCESPVLYDEEHYFNFEENLPKTVPFKVVVKHPY
ncbi:hypothetical protein TL16_g06702 [Triparma laevis f. inornata]|uniref:IPT/TIG domain-containing protein n=1 Tax=Triparma laevis f. inornata TaxID=1714386 RepID=A0A9W7APX4_9STRA|nr:hypothetical protein TL16_g06702 [Triparma laevis f. inornata]